MMTSSEQTTIVVYFTMEKTDGDPIFTYYDADTKVVSRTPVAKEESEWFRQRMLELGLQEL